MSKKSAKKTKAQLSAIARKAAANRPKKSKAELTRIAMKAVRTRRRNEAARKRSTSKRRAKPAVGKTAAAAKTATQQSA